MSGKKNLNQVKSIIKRVPSVQWILRQKGEIENSLNLTHDLSSLIKEKRFVVVHPFLGMGNNNVLTRETVHKYLREWIDIFGIARLRRTTAIAIGSPVGAVLLNMPQALLGIPALHEEYLGSIRHETRKAIHLAERRGYEIREFIWNEYLDDIYAINTSKEIRTGEPIHGWYSEPVQPRYHSTKELKYRKYYGAFKDGKLCAYLHLLISGDFASPIHIMGHAHHLKYGIMNGLISYAVRECIGDPQIRWLYYGRYQEGSSLSVFKKHAGFQKYAIILNLEDDQELLKYSKYKVKALWRI